MKIIITGSRKNIDERLVVFWMDMIVGKAFTTFRGDIEVHFGDAKGVDTYAKNFCQAHQIEFKQHKADWKTHGNSAGIIRNHLMVDEIWDGAEEKAATMTLAFWDKKSKGTKDTIDYARGKGMRTIVIS